MPHWMRDHLPDDKNAQRVSTLRRRDKTTGQPLPPEVSHRGVASGEHRSQTLRVVCVKCNNGWMSQVVEGVRPALEPWVLGQWAELSVQAQQTIAGWYTLHNIVLEQVSTVSKIASPAERQRYMESRDPGTRRFIWMGMTMGAPDLVSFMRSGGSGEPEAPVKAIQLIATAVGKVCFFSLYDPECRVNEKKLEKLQKLLEVVWGMRIWPPTVDPKPLRSEVVPESMNVLFDQVHQVMEGGESALAELLGDSTTMARLLAAHERAIAQIKPPPNERR